MDRVNSQALKIKAYLPSISVYVENSSKFAASSSKILQLFRQTKFAKLAFVFIVTNRKKSISVFWNRDVGVFTVLSLETRVTPIRPRAPEAVSHWLARLHRVSPLSANSRDTPRVHVLGRYARVV